MSVPNFRGELFFLSNFFPCRIEFCGEVYPSVEHAYQASKTDNFEWKRKIRLALTPGKAKRLGDKAPKRADWDAVKIFVMGDLLKIKFNDPVLMEKLKSTGKEEIIEKNCWGDVFWGTYNGVGENWLGKLLMEQRSRRGK